MSTFNNWGLKFICVMRYLVKFIGLLFLFHYSIHVFLSLGTYFGPKTLFVFDRIDVFVRLDLSCNFAVIVSMVSYMLQVMNLDGEKVFIFVK